MAPVANKNIVSQQTSEMKIKILMISVSVSVSVSVSNSGPFVILSNVAHLPTPPPSLPPPLCLIMIKSVVWVDMFKLDEVVLTQQRQREKHERNWYNN